MGQYSEDFILTGKNEKAVFSLKYIEETAWFFWP